MQCPKDFFIKDYEKSPLEYTLHWYEQYLQLHRISKFILEIRIKKYMIMAFLRKHTTNSVGNV